MKINNAGIYKYLRIKFFSKRIVIEPNTNNNINATNSKA
tara:strand:- start:698 stop:814 length:117 start_codon:yes stop_codon:yes gene_type:complete